MLRGLRELLVLKLLQLVLRVRVLVFTVFVWSGQNTKAWTVYEARSSSVWLLTNGRWPSCFIQGLLIYSSQKTRVFSTEAPEREPPRRTHSLRAGAHACSEARLPGRRSQLCRVYSKPAVTVLHPEGKSPLRPRTHTPEKQQDV